MIIGFTGRRGAGKSEAAAALERAGFIRAHAFGGGKAATEAYFRHIGASPAQAREMVHGALRDVPSSLLPKQQTPRYFMERFGHWMGTGLGADWTLGAELARIGRDHAGRSVVCESVVYEADVLRAAGGKIVRIVRPGHKGPEGMKTDEAEARIEADITIVNDGSVEDLKRKVMLLAA